MAQCYWIDNYFFEVSWEEPGQLLEVSQPFHNGQDMPAFQNSPQVPLIEAVSPGMRCYAGK